jgi:hypothetical protein
MDERIEVLCIDGRSVRLQAWIELTRVIQNRNGDLGIPAFVTLALSMLRPVGVEYNGECLYLVTTTTLIPLDESSLHCIRNGDVVLIADPKRREEVCEQISWSRLRR